MATITQKCDATFKIRRDINYSGRNLKICISILYFRTETMTAHIRKIEFVLFRKSRFRLSIKWRAILVNEKMYFRLHELCRSLGEPWTVQANKQKSATVRATYIAQIAQWPSSTAPLSAAAKYSHSSGRQAAKTVRMSRLFSVLISIFRFFPCCLYESSPTFLVSGNHWKCPYNRHSSKDGLPLYRVIEKAGRDLKPL